MKTAKRALAVMIAVLMVASTCVIAASAATSLQAKIDAAAAGATVKLDATASGVTTESVTVNKDITIDLNGQTLFGVMDKAAITVLGGDVTVTNGQVTTTYATNKPTEQMIQTVFDHCPPAILVRGGSLTVEGLRITGGQVRIPGSSPSNPDLLLAGTGIMSYNGAPVTLKRTSIYGDYGVNNAVRQNPAGGVVTVEDAIILAYTKAIKGEYDVADGSEEIIAADRIEGVLNNGITLEEGEKEIIANALDERTLIVTKTAEALTAELEADTPLVTKTEGLSMAELDAPTLDYSWENNKGTDCSYRLVPESIKYLDGTVVELDPDVTNEVEADQVNEDSQIRYRVQFFIGAEAYPYIISLTKEGLDNPLDGVLGWAGEELNSYYTAYTGTNNNGYVDTYDELINELGQLMLTIDSLGNKTVKELLGLTDEEAAQAEVDGYIKDMDVYKQLQQKLYRLAGETGFNAKYNGEYTFTENTWKNIFGADVPMPEYVGTLDRVQELKDQLEEILGPNLFKNTAAYGDLFVWAVETAYPALLTTLDEAIERLTDLKNFLNEGDMADLVAFAGIQKQVKLLDEGVENANKIKQYLDMALANNDVRSTISYVTDNSEAMKGYVDKIVEVIENWRTYITPEKFLVKDEVTGEYAYVKTYSTLGPVEIETIETEGNLHITVSGKGTAAVATDVTSADVTSEATLPFNGTFTLTATPKTNYEFLYWANKEAGTNGYILSTEPTFTMKTEMDRDIEAVFARIDSPVAVFTNPTGDITFISDATSGTAAIEDTKPYIAGYGFVGWPDASDDGVDLSAATTDYASGNSAFAKLGDYYGEEGANLLVNPSSSSYIITPAYSKAGGYTATFIDGDETWIGEGNYSDIATHSAKNGDYWVIDGTDTIVCVNKTFPYQMIDNMTFRSVAGECPVETVTKTTIREENGFAVFYIERSTSKPIKQVGMVFSATDSTPSFGEEGCFLTTSKTTVQTGLYAPSLKISNIPAGGVMYGVPYIEFADGTYYEGDVFHYPG